MPSHSSGRGVLWNVALTALIAASLLLGVQAAWQRHVAERSSTTVAVIVDGREAAAVFGNPAAWERLKRLGVTGVAIYEHTLADVAASGHVFAVSPSVLRALASPLLSYLPADLDPARVVVGWAEGNVPAWLEGRLNHMLPQVAEPLPSGDGFHLWLLDEQRRPEDVVVGFDPELVHAVSSTGLALVPRPLAGPRIVAGEAADRLEVFAGTDTAAVLFGGGEVSGYPDGIGAFAEAIARLGAPVGLIEFSPQRGIEAMANALGYRAVRVHSITDREMAAGIPENVAVDRWLRAARERSVRLLYVRLYPQGSDPAQGDAALDPAAGNRARNEAYLAALVSRLQAEGYTLGIPEPFASGLRGPSWAALAVVVALVGAASGLLLERLLGGVRPRRPVSCALGAVTVSLVFWLLWLKGYTIHARQVAAFAAALAFPVLAVGAGWCGARTGLSRRASDSVRNVRAALLSVVVAALVTLTGALCVVVLLDDVRFMLKLEEFRGVKAAHVLPLGLTFALVYRDAFKGRADHWRRFGGATLLGGACLVAGALVVYVLRTGNQGLPLLELEESARRFLEETFTARPRTKEFLLGHPALIAAFVLASRKPWAAGVLAVAGVIGQISMINTFAHAHTPLAISLLRTGYGWLLGLFIGALLLALGWFALRWLSRKGAKPPHPVSVGGRVRG